MAIIVKVELLLGKNWIIANHHATAHYPCPAPLCRSLISTAPVQTRLAAFLILRTLLFFGTARATFYGMDVWTVKLPTRWDRDLYNHEDHLTDYLTRGSTLKTFFSSNHWNELSPLDYSSEELKNWTKLRSFEWPFYRCHFQRHE